jgi:hypothetical protein
VAINGKPYPCKVVNMEKEQKSEVVNAITTMAHAGLSPVTMIGGRVAKVVNDYLKYAAVAEQEKTRRVQILAERDQAVARLSAQKEIILKYLDETFEERRSVINSAFRQLEGALKADDLTKVDAALTLILGVVKSSPFKNFNDFRRKMADDNFTIEI